MSDKKVKDDKMYCEIIAKSISDIIRFSLNDEFRKRCCELFGVFSTAQTEKEITNRLIKIRQSTGPGSKKRGKKSSKEKDKENVEERSDISDEEKTGQSTVSAECASETVSQNTSQRSWLQISSQKYKTEVKRKKLQFYSQPPYDKQYQKDVEFSSSNSHFSHSQPTSEVPSSSSLTDTMDLDDGISFCKKKFKESFEENSQKYFQENLKYKDVNF